MNYSKPFSKRKLFYSSLIIILTLCSCLFFLLNCYNFCATEDEDGIEMTAGIRVKGFDAISGKYSKLLKKEIKEMNDKSYEYDDYYYDYDYDEDDRDEELREIKSLLSVFDLIQIFAISILIVMIIIAIIEILVICILRKKAGYVTIIITSSIKLIILFIQQLVLFISSSGIQITEDADITFKYGIGMMILVMIQVLEILFSVFLLFVHKYEDKIFKLSYIPQ